MIPALPTINPAKSRLVQELKHSSPLLGCRFDPSGKYVFAGAQDNAVIRWALDGSKRTVLTGHKSWARALAFAPRDGLLFSASYDGKVLVWPLADESPAAKLTLDAHKGWARALALSPDGKVLASCGNDHAVRLWSVHEGKLLRELTGHACHVYNVAFHPTGKQLVSGDLKGVLKVWDLDKGEAVRTLDASALYRYDAIFQADHGGVRGMVFRPDGAVLACCGITDVTNAFAGIGRPLVLLFDWVTGKARQLRPRKNFQGTAWGVAFHPAGYVIAVGGGNGGAVWFYKGEGPQDEVVLEHPINGRDLDLHPHGRRFAVAAADGVLRIYDMTAETQK